MKVWSLALVCVLALGSLDADAARRMGGGGSMGKQSGNVTQRDGGAAQPGAPASPGAAQNQAARPATPAATPAAAAPKRPWGAMLGGLAAGLGLAWLASSLGLGAAFGQFLMFALLALVIMVVVGFIMRKRRQSAGQSSSGRPFAFQGAGSTPDAAVSPSQYRADKIGNDASARPWERSSMAFETGKSGQSGVQIGSGLAAAGSPTWSTPSDFDTDSFLSAAKQNFVTLQAAWDRSDISSLQSMMTDEMLSEIRGQLAERETSGGGQINKTDVVTLDAQLLGIEDLGADYMASVEFSGTIREEAAAEASAFREVWNMTKPKSGNSGWLVAGVQALQ